MDFSLKPSNKNDDKSANESSSNQNITDQTVNKNDTSMKSDTEEESIVFGQQYNFRKRVRFFTNIYSFISTPKRKCQT